MIANKKEILEIAEYLLNFYKDGAPVFPIGSYEYRAMNMVIEALETLPEPSTSETKER